MLAEPSYAEARSARDIGQAGLLIDTLDQSLGELRAQVLQLRDRLDVVLLPESAISAVREDKAEDIQ